MTKSASCPSDADAGALMSLANENEFLPRYGDKRAVARMAAMSARWVDGEMAKGMPHLKLGSRRCRFDLAEVRAWLRETYHVQRRSALKSTLP